MSHILNHLFGPQQNIVLHFSAASLIISIIPRFALKMNTERQRAGLSSCTVKKMTWRTNMYSVALERSFASWTKDKDNNSKIFKQWVCTFLYAVRCAFIQRNPGHQSLVMRCSIEVAGQKNWQPFVIRKGCRCTSSDVSRLIQVFTWK